MKLAILLFVIFAFASYVAAQGSLRDGQFEAAAEAFESGEYERTIPLLEAYEKSHGTSPRLESLRALAYRDLDKPKEAHQAVLVYLRLTANRDMSGSEAHLDMLKLRDEMLEAIEKKYKEDKEKLDKERDEVATSIVEELESFYRSPQIKRSFSSALPASLKSEADDPPGEYFGPPVPAPRAGPGMDGSAELEMWRKVSQSTVAMDYFLFIETFPNGQFTEAARKKMHEIGDPAWNAVRDSHDSSKFRDFIRVNPDSPFLAIAKERMEFHAKVALDWEQIRDARDPSHLRAFEARHPGHALAAESKKIRSEIAWRNIENTTSAAAFANFASEFPESPYAAKAKAAAESLQPKPTIVNEPKKEETDSALLFRMTSVHQHGGVQLGIGDLSFDGARLVFREREQVGMGAPDSSHSFSIACSELKDVKYKYHTLTLVTRSGMEKQLIPTTEKDGSQDKIKEKLEILVKGCALKK